MGLVGWSLGPVVVGPVNRRGDGLVVSGGVWVMDNNNGSGTQTKKKVRRPERLWVKERNLRKMGVRDEMQMCEISDKELGRLTNEEPCELAFILPNVTLEASMAQEKEFMYEARKRLGMWHMWLTSIHFGNGNKRRYFRQRLMSRRKEAPEVENQKLIEHLCLVSGILVCSGKPRDFAQYEKIYKQRMHEEKQNQQKTRKQSSSGAVIAGSLPRRHGVFE